MPIMGSPLVALEAWGSRSETPLGSSQEVIKPFLGGLWSGMCALEPSA